MVLFILMLGMAAAGSSVVFVKLGELNPLVLASYRLLLSGLVLFPWFLRDLKNRKEPFHPKQLTPSILPGIFLALHFVSWIMGARMVPGAHASLITNMSPLVMPFVMYFLIKERITPIEIAGSILTLSGALYLGAKDYSFASEYLTGDLLCFICMIFVTLYLALARRNRKNTALWFYMVPLYLTGGVVCMVIAAATGADFGLHGRGDWASVLGLAVICTVGGHSINNFGMRKLRGQLMALLNLTQILFAAVFSYLAFAELPPVYFYPAGLLILSGPLLVILEKYRREKYNSSKGET